MRLIPSIIFVIACASGLSPGTVAEETATTQSLSPLDRLKGQLNDRDAFERKIRAFDKFYCAIARFNLEEANSLKAVGDMEGARNSVGKARENLELVKSAYELGLHHFPDSALLHNFYGELLHDYYGQIQDAVEHWEAAIRLDETNARAQNNVGMHYLHIGKYEDGLAHMDAALAADPDNPDWSFNLVQVYLTNYVQVMRIRGWDRRKLYEEAMKLSERAVALRPSEYDVLYDHGMNFFLAERFGVTADWKRAAQTWKTARKYARKDIQRFQCWLNEARVHLRAGDGDEARRCLERTQEIMPDNPLVQNLLDEVAN